ncbi:MAG: glycosyltransferase family 4 protein [Armatimonadota bacterium]|nr:glycosyltransferase family 4 protein [Armatimonadota bacterium]
MPQGLLVSANYPPARGGIQNYIYDLYSSLPTGLFHVLTLPRPGGKEFDAAQNLAVTTATCPGFARKLRHLIMVVTAAGLVARHNIRYVHCGVVTPDGRVGYTLKHLTGRPYLVFSYGKDISPEQKPQRLALKRKVLLNAEVVVTISRHTKELLLRLGIADDRIEIIPPPVDVDFFTPGLKDSKIANSLGFEGRKIILSVGRLIERKGFDTMIRALPTVVRAVPEACYAIVGSGAYLRELQDLAEGLGMRNHVLFLGDVEDVNLPDLYRLCDVFALINRTLPNGDCEGFGIVLLEAQACGRPVIGGLAGGVPEALVDGVTGSLVDPLSPEDAAHAIIRVLTDSALAQRMGEAGRRRAEAEFSVQTQARRFQELINRRFGQA